MAAYSRLMQVMGFPEEVFVLRMNASQKVVSKRNRSNGENIYGNNRVWKLDKLDAAMTEYNIKKYVDMEHTNEEELYRYLESESAHIKYT